MIIDERTLSAFLDGEVTEAEAQAIEAALAGDVALQDQLETLMMADQLAQTQFAELAEEPVPLALAAAIKNAPGPAATSAAPQPRSNTPWLAAASVVGALFLGSAGGYFLGQNNAPVQVAQTGGWLADIADYHAVYAQQVRHLVEVPASEAAHIETWMTATLGSDVRIPDLAEHGLTFQGARLLVAAGRPVSQLIYTDAEGRVVALCQISTDTPQDGFDQRNINAFDMVTWGGNGANFVVITDEGRNGLDAIAQTAALQV